MAHPAQSACGSPPPMHGTVSQDVVDHHVKMMETYCPPDARGAPPSR